MNNQQHSAPELSMPLPRPDSLPRHFAGFRNFHAGETLLVCGCGASLNDLASPKRFLTIGVNDVGRLFDPTYLVVLNPRHQFQGDRFRYVESSKAKALFTQLSLGLAHPNIVRLKLGQRGGADLSDPHTLPYTQNSPYVALCLAAYMGAKRIGLIGVDFTDHHFFAQTGRHALANRFEEIDREYHALARELKRLGIQVLNLSQHSRLTAFPKGSLEDWESVALRANGLPSQTGPLNIVSYATTPVAGVPAILARCIRARTPHSANCVWAKCDYGNGVVFDGDIEWTQSRSLAKDALEQADVIIVHNGKTEPAHRNLMADKAVITLAHNYAWNVDQDFIRRGFPGLVVGQYQATLPEFDRWTAVPNPLPLWEPEFQPSSKNERITICYTPSGKHECYPFEHRLYWHAKGYDTTLRVLEHLASRFAIQLEVIRARQVSHKESLAMKGRSHIVIDECVTGSYHRNSLEGLAAGCVVVNALGLRPAITEAFRQCSGDTGPIPFVYATLDSLESVLTSLIERGHQSLTIEGTGNRQWMEDHWAFATQWESFWAPAIDQALQRASPDRLRRAASERAEPSNDIPNGPLAIANPSAQKPPHILPIRGEQPEMPKSPEGVSVILPHGGRERLPHLTAALVNLRQCRGVREIIVVEMGDSPVAVDVARRWSDKYVFVRNPGAFERARAMNVGAGLAEAEIVVWQDNDLLVPVTFLRDATAEFCARHLDYLVPFTSVRYLSESDSRKVMCGALNPADCKPVNVLTSRRDICGGMGLVRRSFLCQYGGMLEGFRGWGGEDNAWSHKVQLFGRTGTTTHSGQHLYHLFHRDSGGYGGRGHIASNPHYADNVALLNRITQIKTPQKFLESFPPPAQRPCPWDLKKQIVFLREDGTKRPNDLAQRIAVSLVDLYRANVEVMPSGWPEGWREGSSPPDAIVLFGTLLALRFLSDEALRPLWQKTVIVLDEDAGVSRDIIQKFAHSGASLVAEATTLQRLEQAGLSPWKLPLSDAGDPSGARAAMALTQPLSLVLGAGGHMATKERTTTLPKTAPRQGPLPVWIYWEGECPDWIKACRQTIFAHAPVVRLLDPQSFAELWDIDRDIDLSRLIPAHRADFIRAFLLARYGGLWIDSDCLVMQSLGPILDGLRDHDFVGHRERSRYISNGFIGARPGSRIAAAFYRRICEVLRSGKPLGWISLGGEPLTKVIDTGNVSWQEIECERIQPICWSNPGAFFAQASDGEHKRAFDERAICYMLSNTAIQKYQTANPEVNLLGQRTFFNYLLQKSLQTKPRVPPIERTSQHLAGWRLSSFCLGAVMELSPRKVLDVGLLGRFGLLIRECCEAEQSLGESQDWQCHVAGIGTPLGGNADRLHPFYNSIQCGDVAALVDSVTEEWDLSILDLASLPGSIQVGQEVFDKLHKFSDYVLVIAPLECTAGRVRDEMDKPAWTLNGFLDREPIRHAIDDSPEGPLHGAFLFSQDDPKHLKQTSGMQQTFTMIYQANRQVGDESVSGPGSCLAQTAEIRQRLPLLFEDLQIRSLLDVPCGDFHWMKELALGLDEYIGADIVKDLVQQNRQRFAGPRRTFLTLDITRDHLPRVDLIFCRDCLVHFPWEDVFHAIRTMRQSGSRFLLTTTFTNPRQNVQVARGDWRPLNLELPPFNFPKPLIVINEKCTEMGGKYADKSLGLWRLEDLPVESAQPFG